MKMKNDLVGMYCLMWLFIVSCLALPREAKGQFDANFTLQNVWGQLQPDMRSLIQCLSDENHKKIKFSRMLDTGQGAKLPKLSQQFMQGKPVYARILFMPGDDKLTRFGAFQCKITKQNINTRIATLKLPPSNLVELEALSPYNVANVGEDVTLELNVTKKLELPIKWRHDGKELPDWTGLTKVELKDVAVSDAGIYESYYEGRRNEGVHALMRVLVRSCPAELYGENCDKECPPCYNGGICQDKWGVCVCPAGFTGENCEIACGGNHFGADCLKFCSPPQNNSNTDELCALHLFCKPDPYGCSCAPGFKGARCMEHCEPGWYGADCKQPCHCAYGISNCNRITGACDGGCARGWRGNSCQIYDPNSNSSYVETTTMVYCSPGSYGPSCERQCHCAGNEHCHIVTGVCPSGCEDGWGGPTCGVCRTGRFGENCEFTCHCEGGHHNCDNKDGYCYSGCEAGWAGFTCQAECTPGRFGPNCASTCHCHPNSTKPCDKFTGKCEGDCEAGFMGEDCQTLCPPTMYGVNCVNKCFCANGAKCTRFDGSCTCEGRWRGITCNESEPQISAARGQEVDVNNQVVLLCTADAVPEPLMNITGSAFPGLDVINRTLEQNQKQVFVKVKPEKAGSFEFMCTARNKHGFDMKKITLTVIAPPRLQSAPVLVSKSNESISLQWKSWEFSIDDGGSPADVPEYLVVYKDSQSSNWEKVDNWITQENYVIDNLVPNTLYSIAIKCRRSLRGEGGPSPILQVKTNCGVPLPEGIPQEFLPEKITQTYVVLTWQNPPETSLRCSLVSYHVTYQPEAFQLFKGTLDTDGIINNITIEDLTPYMSYVFRIYPVTAIGRSNYYAELNMRTAETVPGPVSNLECQAVVEKPEILLVSWDAASEENGVIRGYIVTFMLLDRGQCGLPGEQNDTLQVRQIQSDDTEIALQNLYPYSVYNVSVQARTFAGEGEAVSTLATTAESVPSEAPSNVRLVSSTNTSLSFAWDAIPCEEANGEILYYDYALIQNEDVVNVVSGLKMKRSLDNKTHAVFDSVEDLSVTIKDLKPFTNYGFMVGGATAVGTGIKSDIIFHKTDEGIPDAPEALSIFKVSHDSLGITWEAPFHSNGIISLYRVRTYHRDTSILASQIVQKTEDTNLENPHCVISGLSPAKEYMITVDGKTSAGWGKTSSIFETTLDAAPGEPAEVTVTDNQQTTLNITWKEPLETNGAIIGYKIECKPISSLDPLFEDIPSVVKIREIDGDVNEVFLQDLHPSTQYSVSVLARTSAGYGPPASLHCWTVILGTSFLHFIPMHALNF